MNGRFVAFLFSSGGFLKGSLERSRSLAFLLSFLGFLERAFYKSMVFHGVSRLTRLYPRRLWGAFDALSSRMEGSWLAGVGIFNPLFVFPFVFLAFLSISAYRISNLAMASILIGIAAFMYGAWVSRKANFKGVYLEEVSGKLAFFLLTFGASFLILDLLYVDSIPLLDPLARRYLSVPYTMIASLTVPGGILAIALIGSRLRKGEMSLGDARVYAVLVALAVTFLMSLLGYRTQMLVALLGCVMAMYYSRIVGTAEISLAFFASLLGVSAFGYLRAVEEGSSIAFFEIIRKRVGLTLNVYDWVVNRFWFFGVNRGSVALATFSSFLPIPGPRLGPRTIVARMFGITGISMTSTLFGTIVLDFGIPGVVVFAFFLGLVLGLAYRAVQQTKSPLAIAVFSLLMAYTLVGIETGLVDFNVAMFFFIGIAILVNSLRS